MSTPTDRLAEIKKRAADPFSPVLASDVRYLLALLDELREVLEKFADRRNWYEDGEHLPTWRQRDKDPWTIADEALARPVPEALDKSKPEA